MFSRLYLKHGLKRVSAVCCVSAVGMSLVMTKASAESMPPKQLQLKELKSMTIEAEGNIIAATHKKAEAWAKREADLISKACIDEAKQGAMRYFRVLTYYAPPTKSIYSTLSRETLRKLLNDELAQRLPEKSFKFVKTWTARYLDFWHHNHTKTTFFVEVRWDK